MFCLRIWLLPLFFLSSASPLYLILFLVATYILQRPCVYCSLLLAVLVISLFDFRSDWFEARQFPSASSSASSLSNNSSYSDFLNSTAGVAVSPLLNNASTPLNQLFSEGATLLASTYSSTSAAIKSLAASCTSAHTYADAAAAAAASAASAVAPSGDNKVSWSFLGLEWARNAAGKRELRIPHVNAIVAL